MAGVRDRRLRHGGGRVSSCRVMRIGLFGLNIGAGAAPEVSARLAALAEELGYDSLWLADHVVLPRPRTPASPLDPDTPLLEPLLALAHLAAATSRIRLATGVIVLPQRHPVLLAKQLATADVLSGGRLTFGFGVGYLEPELTALDTPLAGRGARADAYLAAMRALWADEHDTVALRPQPLQRPLPVVVGGHSAAAHRRAVAHADGWYGFLLDRAQTAEQLTSLRAAADADAADRRLEITVSPSERLTPETLAGYEQLGVDRLVVVPRPDASAEQLERFVRANAPAELSSSPA
jgi:probable F420-dependent oxidoreductase